MERIGDQAADTAELSQYLATSVIKGKIHLEEMAKETVQMVNESIAAFVENDLERARGVICLLYTSELADFQLPY